MELGLFVLLIGLLALTRPPRPGRPGDYLRDVKPSWRSTASRATAREARAACASTPPPPPSRAATPARPSCPASAPRACSSRPSRATRASSACRRKAAALGRAGRGPQGLDRRGGAGPRRRDAEPGAAAALGLRPAARPAEPPGRGRRLGPQPHRPLHPGPAGEGRGRPSPEADRVTLLRRLSLDLIGLPPTPAEVDAFLADTRPDAYERLVDRLLASPHYGERWGRHWLDLARYADSNGYSIDAPRSIWKYRDWVIDALNRDLPFDQFTIEQLAGDLLPDATLEQKVATGFHRNTLINQEGGIDLEQFRVEAVVDRVNTTGTVWLGPDGRLLPVPRPQVRPDSARRSTTSSSPSSTTPTSRPRPGHARASWRSGTRSAPRSTRSTSELEERAPRARWPGSARGRGTLKLDVKTSLPGRGPHDLRHALREADRDARSRRSMEVFLAHDQDEGVEGAPRDRWPTLKTREPKFVTTMVLQASEEPRTTHVHLGGDFTRKGDAVAPGRPRRAAAAGVSGTPRPARPGALARRSAQPADGARDGQPPLAAVLRPRPGRDGERLRHPGHAAERTRSCSTGWPPSSSASGWSAEGDAPADRHLGDLPPVVEGPAGPGDASTREPAAGPADRGCGWRPRSSATWPWRRAGC